MRATYEEAKRIDSLGYYWTPQRNKIPCYPGWQTAPSDPYFIEECFSADPGLGNGIRTGMDKAGQSFLVIDFDEKALFESFMTKHRIETTIARSRRAAHIYLKGESPNRKLDKIDIISNRKFVSAPVEICRGQTIREWITPLRPVEKLAEYDPAWWPEVKKEPQPRPPPISLVSDRTVEWARRVLHEEYYSIEGCGGDTGLFRAACFLIQRARLDFNTAYALIQEWNHPPNVVPPWDGPRGEERIRYKLKEAQRLMKG